MQNSFHALLKRKMDTYVHDVYAVTKKFPSDEKFGVTSQFRRSSLSIILNYIEGYARLRKKVHKSFLEISYGSLKESAYLITFAYDEKYITKESHDSLTSQADEIGAMHWSTISKLK